MITNPDDFLFVEGENKDGEHPHGDLDRIDMSVNVMPNRGPDKTDDQGNEYYAIYGKDCAIANEAFSEREIVEKVMRFGEVSDSDIEELKFKFSRSLHGDDSKKRICSLSNVEKYIRDYCINYVSGRMFDPDLSATVVSRKLYHKSEVWHMNYSDEHSDEGELIYDEKDSGDDGEFAGWTEAYGIKEMLYHYNPSKSPNFKDFVNPIISGGKIDIKPGNGLQKQSVDAIFAGLRCMSRIILSVGPSPGVIRYKKISDYNGSISESVADYISIGTTALHKYTINKRFYKKFGTEEMIGMSNTYQDDYSVLLEGGTDNSILRLKFPKKISTGMKLTLVAAGEVRFKSTLTQNEVYTTPYNQQDVRATKGGDWEVRAGFAIPLQTVTPNADGEVNVDAFVCEQKFVAQIELLEKQYFEHGYEWAKSAGAGEYRGYSPYWVVAPYLVLIVDLGDHTKWW